MVVSDRKDEGGEGVYDQGQSSGDSLELFNSESSSYNNSGMS